MKICLGRAWPMFVGSGFGFGYAMSNCQHDFKRVDSLHLQPIRVRISNDAYCVACYTFVTLTTCQLCLAPPI